MTERETTARAKLYLDKLAGGINPLDDTPIPEGELLHNPRIARCLAYVSGMLEQVLEGSVPKPPSRTRKPAFAITRAQLDGFAFSDDPIPVSEITHRINALVEGDGCKKLGTRAIPTWLIEAGFLAEVEQANGRTVKHPTEPGTIMGISLEHRQSARGEYDVVLYDRGAQEFILDNLEAVLEMNDSTNRKGTPC